VVPAIGIVIEKKYKKGVVMSVNSVSSGNSGYVAQKDQSELVTENNRAARDGDWGKTAAVALGILFGAGNGIALITLGALSANPIAIISGVGLLVLSIIALISACYLKNR
jgi:hypothetical protein